jgi:hypothetical protein
VLANSIIRPPFVFEMNVLLIEWQRLQRHRSIFLQGVTKLRWIILEGIDAQLIGRGAGLAAVGIVQVAVQLDLALFEASRTHQVILYSLEDVAAQSCALGLTHEAGQREG